MSLCAPCLDRSDTLIFLVVSLALMAEPFLQPKRGALNATVWMRIDPHSGYRGNTTNLLCTEDLTRQVHRM